MFITFTAPGISQVILKGKEGKEQASTHRKFRSSDRIYPVHEYFPKDFCVELPDVSLARTGSFAGNIRPPPDISGVDPGYIRPSPISLRTLNRSSQMVASCAPELWVEISTPHRNFRSESRIYPVQARYIRY